jgi:hypothetical protein
MEAVAITLQRSKGRKDGTAREYSLENLGG